MPVLKNKSLGFTGTRTEPTDKQAIALWRLLRRKWVGKFNVIVHHGGCVGADAMMDEYARQHNWGVILHPPIKQDYEATLPIYQRRTELVCKSYLSRNQDIVTDCDLLLAVPKTTQWRARSGTWSTINYARKQGKSIWFVYPDGQVALETEKDR